MKIKNAVVSRVVDLRIVLFDVFSYHCLTLSLCYSFALSPYDLGTGEMSKGPFFGFWTISVSLRRRLQSAADRNDADDADDTDDSTKAES